MNTIAWETEMKKGLVELLVLKIIRKEKTFASKIVAEVLNCSATPITSNTIYPLLARLQKAGYILCSWEEETAYKQPRKCYTLSDEGKIYLGAIEEKWNNFQNFINNIDSTQN